MSSTSGSRSQPSPSGALSPTKVSSPRYQTGSWCPHQSCREMHQGRMFSSQFRYTPVQGFSGWNLIVPSFTTSIAGPRQLVHVAEPLERDQRLHAPARAVRVRHVVHVGLGPGDEALLAQLGHHGVERLGRLHPAEALRRGVRDAAVLADHRDLLEAVPAADVEVALVVARGDLERARAELGIHVVVGDDRQPPAHERQDRRLAYQPRVALIGRVHRDGGVGQHRLRAHGRHRDRAGSRLERVVDHVERVLHGPLLDLEVRDRGAQAGVPVDHVVVAVDEALLVQVHEHLGDRAHVVLVHREALVLVVERRTQLPELARDVVAVLLHPLPDALDERLAPDLLARAALGLELLLHHPLRGDARVVLPVDPLGALPAHARDPDLEVLDRRVQRVPHVQVAGHVRRRHGDRVVLVGRSLGLRMEDAGLLPAREHARLHVGGLVARALLERLQSVLGHRVRKFRSAECLGP